MITFNEALKSVEEKLKSFDDKNEDWLFKIMLDETIETDDYWVFFYNSSKFLETGDISYALAGNAPFIVDKYRGELHVTGTAYSIEFYMDQFEKTNLPNLKEKM